ncbi:MAG TPA: hypothetical protein VMT16_09595 [Thermoanaerobaculia bacterium]|nr:hypothetical protein [Thermoanaerobaculia bacterium]
MSRRQPTLLVGLMLGLLGPGALLGSDLLPDARVVACAPGVIDLGAADAPAYLGEGFHQIEGDFAWTSGPAHVDLPLAAGGVRRVRATVRADRPGQRLGARWNGASLGGREVPTGWAELEWTAPRTRPGHNRLELLPARIDRNPADPRPLGVAVRRLEVLPAECAAQGPPPTFATRGTVLPSGAVLLAPAAVPPDARLAVDLSGEPGARLRLFAWSGTHQRELGELVVGPDGRRRADLALEGCCLGPGGVAAVVSGELSVRLASLALRGNEGGWAWRRACQVPAVEALLLLLLVGALVAARRSGRVRQLSGAAFLRTAWLDAGAVLLLALVLRGGFLQLYPEPGQAADAYEYLLRARALADGTASFLGDTYWHAWQTWIRPPGHYVFLAAVLGPLKGSPTAVIHLQAVLSAVAAAKSCARRWPGW